MTCIPGTLHIVGGDFVFPRHTHGDPYTPVDIPIAGCGLGDGLAMLDPAGGTLSIGIRTWGVPDENFNWTYTGWWIAQDFTVRYTGRSDTHILGVTRYPSKGKIDNGVGVDTGYYNPNAYWVPPTADPVPPADIPPGADPDATYGQDPTTTEPPHHSTFVNRPYHYADLTIRDLMGTNRTGIDLDEDPTDEGVFLDPAFPGIPVMTFLYDDQDPDHSNLANFDWEPDGESTENQVVALMSARKEAARHIRKIARNRSSRKEIGTYSKWDGIGGSNVEDVSEDNVAGHAAAEVERYGRPPNFFKLYLKLEPAAGTPARGDGEDPAPGWQPQPFRDFFHGDRVLARGRKGYMDTGLLVGRIMSMKISQADADNNVSVELECIPHAGDVTEIDVV